VTISTTEFALVFVAALALLKPPSGSVEVVVAVVLKNWKLPFVVPQTAVLPAAPAVVAPPVAAPPTDELPPTVIVLPPVVAVPEPPTLVAPPTAKPPWPTVPP